MGFRRPRFKGSCDDWTAEVVPEGWTDWRIASGSREWLCVRRSETVLSIQEGDKSIGGIWMPFWQPNETPRIQIESAAYPLVLDPQSGYRLLDSAGVPLLRCSRPWKDSDREAGVVLLTTLLQPTGVIPDLLLLSASCCIAECVRIAHSDVPS
jgi:hypothetical protein